MAIHLRAPKARLLNNASVGEFFSEPRRNIFGSPVFGAPLDPASKEVPPALVFIVSYIESKVLTVPGMLQSPPKWDEVLQYTGKMELGEITDHSEIQNPRVAMEILKIYLKDLPEPLLTYELYEPLMAINEVIADASDLEIPQHLGYLKDLLRTLPYVNQLVVCYLVSFFSWLSNHAEMTKTSHMNLGGIFGPYFLRPRHVSRAAGYSTADAVSLLSVLIARAGQLLPNLDGYPEALALLNLQQSPLDNLASRPQKNKSKDPFASIRPGKRKTPATIRAKTIDIDDEDGPLPGPTKAGLVMAPPGYTIEALHKEPLKGPFHLIDAELYEPLYQQNLANKEQLVYVALDVEYGPLVLCQEKATNARGDSIRCILFHSYGTELISAPPNCKKISEMLKFVRVLYPSIPPQMKFSELNDPTMPNELREYERKNMSKGAKFGVVFRRAGQTVEDDIFANNDVTHKGWNDFLAFLGDKIVLNGFDGFRGGLDAKNGSTGTHSVYTKFCKTEIMFHIAPMLPWYPNDKQQLERKRHIGNDLAVIVFQEDETEFNPTWLTSEMNHVFIVVTACKDSWKVGIVSKKAVRTVAPNLPEPSIIPRNQLGREFFLTKVLNVERATLHAPVFEKKLARTRRMLLENLIGESYNRRKAKMPKPSRPDGARKSILNQLPQIASLQRPKRMSTSDVADQKALSTPEVAKPAISEPSLVSVTHAHTTEEGEDLLTMASSKHVKKALASRVDALYRDTDVTMMMARDLADADEEEVAGLATANAAAAATATATPSGESSLAVEKGAVGKLQVDVGRQRAFSDSPMPGKGHSRKHSNSPDATTLLNLEAKRRASEIITRLNGYVDTCGKMQSMERTITLSKVLKACHDIVDQNVQEYNSSLLPPAGKLTEAVGVSLPHLKESCKKTVGLFSDKFLGLLTVTLKVNNSADCVSLTKNIHVLESLLAAYDSSPDSLKDIPTEKPPRDPARELANAITGAPMPSLTRKSWGKDRERPMSAGHELSPAMPTTPSPHRENKERARLSGSHTENKTSSKHEREISAPEPYADKSDRHSGGGVSIIVPAQTPLSTPAKRHTLDEPPLPSAAKLAAAESKATRSSGTPPLTRSMTDLRMVGQHLLQAMQRTQWKLLALHRQVRDGQLPPSSAASILGQFTVQSQSAGSFLEAVGQFSALKRDVRETLEMGDMSSAQLRLVEATKATKTVNAVLDSWFASHPFVAPANIVALAEGAMRRCSNGLSELSAAMLKTGISAVANRCTRLYRSIAKFLVTQEELAVPPQVEANGALMTDAQHKALAELMEFLIAEAQSKLHALVHHIRNSSSDPNRKWETLSQLETLERVASLLSTEIQALTAPPARPLPPPPAGGAAQATISDEELERLRSTLSYTAEVTENSIAMVESVTRQCQSLNLATALAALAVLLKKLRAGEPNLNLMAMRVDSTADAGLLAPEQLSKLEHIRKLATTVFADTRVFMLTMSAEIASSNSASDLLTNAKLVANFKKALDDFVATNTEHCLP